MRIVLRRLTAMGNAVGLTGGFGAQWGFMQLRRRLDALETAVMEDPEPLEELDWDEIARSLK